MRIGLIPEGLLTWQGGREFFRLATTGLRLAARAEDRLQIVYPADRSSPPHRLARIAKRLLLGRASWTWIREEAGRKGTRSAVRDLLGPGFALRAQRKGAFRDLDVIGPLSSPPCEAGKKTPWVGYIFDLQHKRLPHMFAEAERAARDRQFVSILRGAGAVVVNARSVKDDLAHFYSDHQCPVVVLPFSPVPEAAWLREDRTLLARYRITAPFFICSNQFWKHKNHGVIIETVALARDIGQDVRFVLTNAVEDARHPDYVPGLMARIAALGIGERMSILGLIPKVDQIGLMRAAVAVVQPSLFEGGPGGGSIYNAVAVGKPTVVSDIPVNREIEPFVTRYFDPHDPSELLAALQAISALAPPPASPRELLERGRAHERAYGEAVRHAFVLAAAGGRRGAQAV